LETSTTFPTPTVFASVPELFCVSAPGEGLGIELGGGSVRVRDESRHGFKPHRKQQWPNGRALPTIH
jgi:hypothetical protein